MSFPRQHARTRRFSLGIPRSFTLAPDGRRVLFLRSERGDDPTTSLMLLTVDDGVEHRLVDATDLAEDATDLPPAERARRERAREMASGLTAYATDAGVELAAFAVGGRLHTVEVDTGTVIAHPVASGAFDPRPDPDGRRVAYVVGDNLHLLDLIGGRRAPGATRPLAVEPGVSWGRAEFVAAEEMGRGRGFWWSPDGSRLAVTRVDESAVHEWYIADPGSPDREPVAHRYPAAGTANADVRLAILGVDDGRRVDVGWDRQRLPYLARVTWGPGPLTLLVQSRDQRLAQVLVVDDETGSTRCVREIEDTSWVELVPGAPAWAGDRLVTVEDLPGHGTTGSRALVVDGEPVTAPGLQVRSLVAASAQRITFVATAEDPTQVHVWHHDPGDGRTWSPTEHEPGVHAAMANDVVTVISSQQLARPRMRVQVRDLRGPQEVEHEVAVVAQTPEVRPQPKLLELGDRGLRAALLLPEDATDASLPVVLDPYGGPHVQRVLQSPNAYLTSQWLADQGFAVLVVDGRGSPGRGPRWERAVHHDLATPVLDDQVDALEHAGRVEPRLDLDRVGIRGWSFGGYLAALAVLRRPDVFRAGVAGAPVTDWRLYDTHYTERYLGHPDEHPEAYRISSLVDEAGELLGAAAAPPRGWPRLLLIHGLADDNVVAAHALRLSSALLAAGRPHEFLPLTGVTHMTPQEVVAERLLTTQVAFLHDALA